MHGPRFRPALLVALAVMALCAGLGVRATATEGSTADDGTITTTLYPGWNMVGWVGPETPASELFDELPALGRIFAWDAEEQRYLRLMPSSRSVGDQHLLTPGDGLWLYIGGTSPVEWTREASEDSVLLDLRAGPNLVAWAGRNETPVEEATVRFGENLERAWRWDAEAQEYRLYAPDAGLDQVGELNHGDAVLVELSSAGRWWQSGTARVPVEIVGEYTELKEWQIRGWVDGNRGFFAERWGVEAPVTLYVGDRESVTRVYRRVLGRSGGLPSCGYYAGRENIIFLADDCVNGGVHAHEYFHVIQSHLAGQQWKEVPLWIREGSADYALFMYGATPHRNMIYPDAPSSARTIQERIDEFREKYAAVGYGYWPALSETEGGSDVTGPFPTGVYYQLGFLGIAWLAEQVGDQAVVDFFAHLADEENWRQAFERAFGMSTDEFHRQFDAYRAAAAPLLPHRTDGRDEPVVEFVGDIQSATQSAVLAEFDRVHAFLQEQFGAGTTDYTVFVFDGVDRASEAHMRVFGTGWDRPSCEKQAFGNAMLVSVRCYPSLLQFHFRAARALTGGVHSEVGPYWLVAGAVSHVRSTYDAAGGRLDEETVREVNESRAALTQVRLRDLAGRSAFRAEGASAYALSALAMDTLLQLAGSPALFEYYRLLGDSVSSHEAFSEAFGITVGEFYAVFEAYRSGVAPRPPAAEAASVDDAAAGGILPRGRFPHLNDDIDAPVLVFVGELHPATRVALREDFEAVLAFFRDRLGAPAADYTLYVGADAPSLRDVYRRVDGRESTHPWYCTVPRGIVVLISLQCEPGLAAQHALFVLDGLAVTGVTPAGYPSQGPAWLTNGTQWYVSAVYPVARGSEELDRTRSARAVLAARTQLPLSRLATSAGYRAGSTGARGLGFLAVDWLVERAGERALFDYYRRLARSASWEDAFEAAFDITVDDFYEAFEAYRARGASPDADAVPS